MYSNCGAGQGLKIWSGHGTTASKCQSPKKRGVTQLNIYGIDSKVNQFICALVLNYMPNIRILAYGVLQIFCSKRYSYI